MTWTVVLSCRGLFLASTAAIRLLANFSAVTVGRTSSWAAISLSESVRIPSLARTMTSP